MPDNSPRALRRMLRLARMSLGMTQASLGDALGSASRTVIRWEQGRSIPDTGRMLRLADMVRGEDSELATALLESAGIAPRPVPAPKPAVLAAFARAAELEVNVAELLEGLRSLA